MDKRGLSPVIAVVLLLLITIIAAGLIISFVIPFARDNLDSSGACFGVLGDLNFDETPYNCVNSSAFTNEGRTGFSVRIDNDEIVGFRVSLLASGSSDAENIEQGAMFSNIRMLLNDFDTALSVPANGGVRTYVGRGVFEKVEIFPILSSGAKCDIADEIKVSECEDVSVSNQLAAF